MAPQGDKGKKSLIRIADVIRAGERLSTEHKGVLNYLLPDLEVAVSSMPASTQGGDFHGLIYLDSNRAAIFIGDVAGHDFSSSIPAAEAIRYFDDNHEKLLHPHLFLRSLNSKMHKPLSSVGRFITAAVALLDLNANIISYSSAGHPQAMLFNHEENTVEMIGERMLPVGFEDNLSFKLIQKHFLPGDMLLLCTDGITSGRSAEKEEFGVDRLREILVSNSGTPAEIVHKIVQEHRAFCINSPETDDETIVLARRALRD